MVGPLSMSATAALQPFCESDPIVRRRIKLPRPGGLDEAMPQIKSTRGLVVGSGRCFCNHHSGVLSLEPSFNLVQEDGSAAGPLPRRIHGDPIQIVRAVRRRRWAEAGKARQLIFRGEGAEEEIIRAGWSSHRARGVCSIRAACRAKDRIEKLESDGNFLRAKQLVRPEDLADAVAMRKGEHPHADYGPQLVPDSRSARGQSSAAFTAG